MKRIYVRPDLLKQSKHYLEQYHSMMVVWATKTIASMPVGNEREKFRNGMADLFNELESTIARIQEDLGENPKTIEEATALLRTPEYKDLLDKARAQQFITATKNKLNLPKIFLHALDTAFTSIITKFINLWRTN